MSRQRQTLLEARARELREHPTLSEARLWQELRGGRLGAAFRRQVVIGNYIVDFLAPESRLVVEVDGGYHIGRGTADARRDAVLRRAGYRVVRVAAEDVMRELPAVLRLLQLELRNKPRPF
jgi:very-short-patch-repair endonuclease